MQVNRRRLYLPICIAFLTGATISAIIGIVVWVSFTWKPYRRELRGNVHYSPNGTVIALGRVALSFPLSAPGIASGRSFAIADNGSVPGQFADFSVSDDGSQPTVSPAVSVTYLDGVSFIHVGSIDVALGSTQEFLCVGGRVFQLADGGSVVVSFNDNGIPISGAAELPVLVPPKLIRDLDRSNPQRTAN